MNDKELRELEMWVMARIGTLNARQQILDVIKEVKKLRSEVNELEELCILHAIKTGKVNPAAIHFGPGVGLTEEDIKSENCFPSIKEFVDNQNEQK